MHGVHGNTGHMNNSVITMMARRLGRSAHYSTAIHDKSLRYQCLQNAN